jgi:PPM family protein phosphatase
MSLPGMINAFLRTDVGRVREHNEDFVTYREPADAADEALHGWIYLVADGVGGADAGEIASQFASERTLENYLNDELNPDWGRRLVEAMQTANSDLRQMVAERDSNSRMATTMVAVVLRGNQAYFANVGDSRAYLWRDGVIEQITKDQSLVAKLLEEGAITAEEAEYHPRRNVILYSLGSERHPKIDLFEKTLLPGDIILLCSDGLTRHVSDEELAYLITGGEPAEVTQTLIDLANSRGGQDNISAAVLHYGEQDTGSNQPEVGAATAVAPTVISVPGPTSQKRENLWGFTFLLSLVQTILILTLWVWLFI